MSDQLSLRLSSDAPRLPRMLRPMLPKPATEPFDSEEHVFEPSWGGLRALAFVEAERSGRPARVRLLDATGRDLAVHVPELAVIADLVRDVPAILDGELVVPDRTGHMDDAALDGRLADGQATGMPPVFLAFDLLWTGGRPIIAQPLIKRRERLARTVEPAQELVVVPGIVAEGRDLHAAVAEQGLAGVMARHLRSPYLPGRASELWRWIPSAVREPAAEPHGRTHPERKLRLLEAPAPAPQAPDAPAPRPLLALIQRLPLED